MKTENDWEIDKYRDSLMSFTTLKPVHPDKGGASKQFQCVRCERIITMYTVMQNCNYDYCPWCGREIL